MLILKKIYHFHTKVYNNKLSVYTYIICALIVQLLLSHLFGFLAEMIGMPNTFKGPDFSKMSETEIFFIAVLAVPFIETLIFQFAIIKIIQKITKNILISIFVSSVFFGISHAYNSLYIFTMIFSGALFAYSFVVAQNRRWYAFWVVFAIHSLYNLFVFAERTYFS